MSEIEPVSELPLSVVEDGAVFRPAAEMLDLIRAIETLDMATGVVEALFASPVIHYCTYDFRTGIGDSNRPDWRFNRKTNRTRPHIPEFAGDYFAPAFITEEGLLWIIVPFRGKFSSNSLLRIAFDLELSGLNPDRHSYAQRLLYITAALHEKIADLFKKEKVSLTAKESMCLNLVFKGHKIKEIPKIMNLSEPTINLYLSRARMKLNCESTLQAIVKAGDLGLLENR